MLQACLNGDRRKSFSPAVPCTPDELARDARAGVDAGADELHVHPRDAQGLETLEPACVSVALDAMRNSAPGVPIGLSTRWAIQPSGRARQQPIAAWSVLPNYVSVNLIEDDAPEVISLVLSKGIGVEAGLWSQQDAKRLAALDNAEGSMSKLVAGETAVRVTEQAIQVMGGYGYIREHPVERWHRDSKIYTIFEGTSEIQRLIIARAVSGIHIL